MKMDAELTGTSRDMLIQVHAMVHELVKSKDDHEMRIRANEMAVADIRSEKRANADSVRRLIAWGMLLAAMAGGFGSFMVRAMTAR